MEPALSTGNFGLLDWSIVLGYLIFTTILGERLAGKQATIRDFFLGGRTLPWYAVAGSIISTEISAVTFVVVPSVVCKPDGNFTYLQFGLIGSVIARWIVAYVLVPAYYQREIYSPYDYMGNQLGGAVKAVCSALFAFGGVLAQAARLYLTAVVLELVLPQSVLNAAEQYTGLSSLSVSILLMGFVAIVWTLLGGMSTVIWTDVISFLVFVLGAAVALIAIAWKLEGGFSELVDAGIAAEKFRFIDPDLDPTKAYTIWAAAIAVPIGNVGALGTDQLMAQRMFCCRNAKDASRAVMWSTAGMIITVLVAFVGVGLFAFYQLHPLTGDALAKVTAKPDRILPIFILQELPPGLTGLVIAGIFAAAISGLDSIFVALAQTAMSTIYQPRRERWLRLCTGDPAATLDSPEEERRSVRVSKLLVIAAGLLLSVVAIRLDRVAANYPSILDLALSLATYSQGGLLAAFLLAFLPLRRDGYGLIWSVPLSALAVFAMNWQPRVLADHPIWPMVVCVSAGVVLLASYLAVELQKSSREGSVPLGGVLALVLGILVVLGLNRYANFEVASIFAADGTTIPRYDALAYPWHAAIGCVIAFVFGIALGRPRRLSADPAQSASPS